MIYYILLFFLILFHNQLKDKPIKSQKTVALFFMLFMMIMVGIRGLNVGVDSEQYATKFTFVHDINILSYEPLFQLLINILNNYSTRVLWFFFTIAALTYMCYGYTVLKYSKIPLLTILVFMASFVHFFPETMNNLRQGVAIMLLLISYIFYAKKIYYLTTVFWLLAFGFHFSSIIAVPFYFICNIKIDNKKIGAYLGNVV